MDRLPRRSGWDELVEPQESVTAEVWQCNCCGDLFDAWQFDEQEICEDCEAVDATIRSLQNMANAILTRYIRGNLSIAEFDSWAMAIRTKAKEAA